MYIHIYKNDMCVLYYKNKLHINLTKVRIFNTQCDGGYIGSAV
jgi:hypothetical protein